MRVDLLENDEFVEWLYSKFKMYKEKKELQMKIQALLSSVEDGTFKPEPDKKMVAVINGHEKISYIKDSPNRQFTLLISKLRNIEEQERGGFKMSFKNKQVEENGRKDTL